MHYITELYSMQGIRCIKMYELSNGKYLDCGNVHLLVLPNFNTS